MADKDGNKKPGQTNLAWINQDFRNEMRKVSAEFFDVLPKEESENKWFVCFELHIAVDERQTSGINTAMNDDLCLLFNKSLLADAVLCVSGREISVHRIILAARWPRFYDTFLANSKERLINISGIEADILQKLLLGVYSNRMSTSLIQDPACKEIEHILELPWLADRSHTPKRHYCSR